MPCSRLPRIVRDYMHPDHTQNAGPPAHERLSPPGRVAALWRLVATLIKGPGRGHAKRSGYRRSAIISG